MYESIRDWLNVPITIKPYVGRSSTGTKLFGTSYSALCYPQGEVNIVRNWQGVEVVSHTHLYVAGNTPVTKLDNVIFEGEDMPVQAISTYYRNGIPDIRVVYV